MGVWAVLDYCNSECCSPMVPLQVLLVLTQDDEGTRSSHLYRHFPDANGAYSTANISQQIGSLWSTADSMKLSAADDSVVRRRFASHLPRPD